MNTRYILGCIGLATCFLMSACYSDDSNTDLKDQEKITFEGLPASLSLVQDVDTIHIVPKVSSNYGSEWTYSWDYYKSSSPRELFHLTNEKDLSQVCHLPVGNYTLVFTAKNQQTNLSQISTIPVEVNSPYTIGWYVLKDDGTNADLDLFSSKSDGTFDTPPTGASVESIISTKTGQPLKGKGVKVVFNTDVPDASGNYHRCVTAASEHDFGIYDTQDMSTMLDDTNGSFLPDMKFDPVLFFCNAGGFNNFMISGGRLYASSTSGTGYFLYSTDLDRSDVKYDLVPFLTASYNFMFYDMLSESFIFGTSYGDGLTTCGGTAGGDVISPVHTGLKCLYMGTSNYKGYGVFESKSTGQRDILSYKCSASPSVTIVEALDDNDRMNKAEMMTIANDVTVFYFLDPTSGDVYSHMLNTAGEERREFDVPADETVTFIRQVRHYYIDKLNHIMIATVKGSGKNATYTIRLFPLVGGHFSDEATSYRLSGKGYARDANFMQTRGSSMYYNFRDIYK